MYKVLMGAEYFKTCSIVPNDTSWCVEQVSRPSQGKSWFCKKKENPSSFALKVTKTFSLIKNLRAPFPLLVNSTKYKGT